MPDSRPTNEAVFIYVGSNNEQSTRDFAIMLNEWSTKVDNFGRPIRILMNSAGGNILDSLFLYQIFCLLRKRGHYLTIVAYGRCSSCSGWLLQAADKRVIGAESWILIHQVSSRADGYLDAMLAEIARCKQLRAQTDHLLTFRTKGKLTVETIRRRTKGGREWWIDAKTAKAHGLVDEVEETPDFPV